MTRTKGSLRKYAYVAFGVGLWEILHTFGFLAAGWMAHGLYHHSPIHEESYVPAAQCFQPSCVTREDHGRTWRFPGTGTIVECYYDDRRGGEWIRVHFPDDPEAGWRAAGGFREDLS